MGAYRRFFKEAGIWDDGDRGAAAASSIVECFILRQRGCAFQNHRCCGKGPHRSDFSDSGRQVTSEEGQKGVDEPV